MDSASVDYLLLIKIVSGNSACKPGRKYLVVGNPMHALRLLDSGRPEWRDHP
jgi:hypothetical protein